MAAHFQFQRPVEGIHFAREMWPNNEREMDKVSGKMNFGELSFQVLK